MCGTYVLMSEIHESHILNSIPPIFFVIVVFRVRIRAPEVRSLRLTIFGQSRRDLKSKKIRLVKTNNREK